MRELSEGLALQSCEMVTGYLFLLLRSALQLGLVQTFKVGPAVFAPLCLLLPLDSTVISWIMDHFICTESRFSDTAYSFVVDWPVDPIVDSNTSTTWSLIASRTYVAGTLKRKGLADLPPYPGVCVVLHIVAHSLHSFISFV